MVSKQIIKTFMIEDFFHLPLVSTKISWYFAALVVDTGGAPRPANISANFRKKWDTLGLGETDSWKKAEAKNLVTLSL